MDFNTKIIQAQKSVCAAHKADFCNTPADLKLGIALNVKEPIRPINGLRHPPEAGASGWYIWAGEELSTDPPFFQPIHAAHLQERCPLALKYLGLAPGWRFLVTEEYEDVWFDPSLLAVTKN